MLWPTDQPQQHAVTPPVAVAVPPRLPRPREGLRGWLRHWKLKGVLQGVIARLPGGDALNTALQRVMGGRRDDGRHIDVKIEADGLVHLAHLSELGFRVPGKTIMEVGTGWLPVLPLMFAVAGAVACHSFDLRPLLRVRAATRIVLRLERHLPAIAQASQQPLADVQARWQRLVQASQRSDAAVLECAGLTYHAPADATRTALAPGSVDLVFSNSVLEHVTAAVLPPLFVEARRVLRPDGLMLHNVNCGDHYAYFDPSITPIHYLRFSEEQWRRWNNDLLYQNRLRPRDFLGAARDAGFEVVLDRHRARPELLAALPQMPIAPEFAHYPPEELACTSLDFAARPQGAA